MNVDKARELIVEARRKMASRVVTAIDDIEREAIEIVGLLDEAEKVLTPDAPTVEVPRGPDIWVWPTDFKGVKHITQHFGERPEYYSKFGLPGHEGLDIRAPNGSNVYAVAAGVVKMAAWGKRTLAGNVHPYGYQIRIVHNMPDGEYESIYAHLTADSAKVKPGDRVEPGRLIALADNTGNTSAAHLHLTIKKRGAKNGGYGEIVDPLPLLMKALKA